MQFKALKNALVRFLGNIKNYEEIKPLMEVIHHKHCALNVTKEHYYLI